jgi:hypothetical protein
LAKKRDIMFFYDRGFNHEQIVKKTGFKKDTVKDVIEEELKARDIRWRKGYIKKLPKGGKRK